MSFLREPELSIGSTTLARGDELRVRGIHGTRFKFYARTINPTTGAEWIDCFELFRGIGGVMRSFPVDRAVRIPKKRKK